MRKSEQVRDEMVKDENDQILLAGVEVRRRWSEYFEQVQNVEDVREANMNVNEMFKERWYGSVRMAN